MKDIKNSELAKTEESTKKSSWLFQFTKLVLMLSIATSVVILEKFNEEYQISNFGKFWFRITLISFLYLTFKDATIANLFPLFEHEKINTYGTFVQEEITEITINEFNHVYLEFVIILLNGLFVVIFNEVNLHNSNKFSIVGFILLCSMSILSIMQFMKDTRQI